MKRYWKVAATKDGKKVTLFTFTSDEQVNTDLKLDPSRSLIDLVRRHRGRAEGNDNQNHIDLATGAFQMHRGAQMVRDARIEETDQLPSNEPVTSLGGDGRTFLMSIWEEPEK